LCATAEKGKTLNGSKIAGGKERGEPRDEAKKRETLSQERIREYNQPEEGKHSPRERGVSGWKEKIRTPSSREEGKKEGRRTGKGEALTHVTCSEEERRPALLFEEGGSCEKKGRSLLMNKREDEKSRSTSIY